MPTAQFNHNLVRICKRHYRNPIYLAKGWRGIIGDSAQLGVDFIIGQDGLYLLKHPNQEATDRPRVSGIFIVLKEGVE